LVTNGECGANRAPWFTTIHNEDFPVVRMNQRLAIIGLGALALLASCSRRHSEANAVAAPSRAEIWAAIQPQAARYQIDPAFVYALVAAESNFDPRARRGDSRGLLQLMPGAWRAVSSEPYEPAVWDWRTNLAVGIDYIAYVRSYLHRKTTFSYPKLLAAFHYGIDYLEARNFDVSRVPVPNHPLYRELWRGNLTPVPPPQ
jgi:soluble lytic murein transglycosylase-like protein